MAVVDVTRSGALNFESEDSLTARRIWLGSTTEKVLWVSLTYTITGTFCEYTID